jgi:tungstate transport system ATP-binding protein
MALIETIGLEKKYGDHYALRSINLKIERGEKFVLLGPSGAGKTTLLRLLDFLDLPTAGSLLFDGVEIGHSAHHRLEVRRKISYVQQKPVVFDTSVYDNIACGLRWRHEKARTVAQRVDEVIEQVALADYKGRNARTLSGGEVQRVAIARALATGPEVLLLDEPAANLDPISTSKIEDVMARVIAERKITVVMATHDLSRGHYMASRMGVLMGGELAQVGSPGDVFGSPKNRQVAEFVGIENILDGVVVAKDGSLASIEVNGTTIQTLSDSAVGDEVYVLIRPEDITLTLTPDKTSARNRFQGSVVKVTSVGPIVRIEVDCGFPLLVAVTKMATQELELARGREVYLSFKATATHTIGKWH